MGKSIVSLFIVLTFGFGFTLTSMAEDGVTDKEIHIGQWGPLTGPAASWGSVLRGTDVLFKMINDEGGIHGRKIVYHMFDDSYSPVKTLAGVKQLQESVGIFAWAGGVGTSTGLAVKDYIMSKKVPWVGPVSGSIHWIMPPQKYLFAVYPLYYMEARVLARYALEKMGKKRFAMIYQNDDYGTYGLDGAEIEIKNHGLKLLAKIPVETSDTDLRPSIVKLKKVNPEVVLIWLNPTQAINVVRNSNIENFKPQWMTTSTCSDFEYMYKLSKSHWEGVFSVLFSELPNSNLPLMQKYRNAYEKYGSKEDRWGPFFYAGIGLLEPMIEALKRCGRDLTREKFIKEMEGIKNFKGISGNISYKPFDPEDPECRQGQKEVFVIQCQKNGQTKVLSDWMEIKIK
ncbi:MAG: ABC transporter substrate-binding protein [Desulfobacterales bacterium]|nr:ABC transporter substrate-binding protein [Desulfobacterales bacterium]